MHFFGRRMLSRQQFYHGLQLNLSYVHVSIRVEFEEEGLQLPEIRQPLKALPLALLVHVGNNGFISDRQELTSRCIAV